MPTSSEIQTPKKKARKESLKSDVGRKAKKRAYDEMEYEDEIEEGSPDGTKAKVSFFRSL